MVDRLGLPMMLKPDQGGSALGAQVVRDAADLPAAMVGCLAYGETVLAERFVDGVEVAVTVVDGPDGPEALPAVEIVPETGVYDYTARYTAGLTDFHTPARLDDRGERRSPSSRWRRTGCSGCATSRGPTRSWRADGTVYFLEVNSSPGLTETSLLPMAVEAAGRSLGDIYAGLIERAVDRARG